MKAPTLILMDVDQHAGLPFPRSLREFQRLTWLTGIHHGVSERHLQAYLNEFTFRFNRRFYPFNAFRSLLGIASDAKAPTYAQLYSGDWNHPTSSGCMR